ncbi:hypothetical protein Tdes44962_MAKER10176 [Teratosphaeria destructans]|uniref:Uncharacterized protein n=1 Tax=Teratosphaeria destructans TaxID=418781 RepID=A0A9W7W0E3_9PEZI|nr:hypothetical protein Tdes44962_MAKER10176 [Teratosphaeria destructans]
MAFAVPRVWRLPGPVAQKVGLSVALGLGWLVVVAGTVRAVRIFEGVAREPGRDVGWLRHEYLGCGGGQRRDPLCGDAGAEAGVDAVRPGRGRGSGSAESAAVVGGEAVEVAGVGLGEGESAGGVF